MGYLTLCEALTGGAFGGVNCQRRGAFDLSFPGGGEMGILGIVNQTVTK